MVGIRRWLERNSGDLTQTAESLEEDGSVPQDADLFPHALPGLAQQGAKDYLVLGCMTCHTQQVRMVEAGFDAEKGGANAPPLLVITSFRNMCS